MKLELNQIICGDCLEVMRSMPSESVDLVVTSPPYNLGKPSKQYSIHKKVGSIGRNKMITESYDTASDDMNCEQYILWQRDILAECLRLIKKTGAIFYNHKPRIKNGLLNSCSDILADFPVRQTIIWQRDGGLNFTNSYFLPTYEYVFLIAKPDFKLKRKANAIGDVWRINAGSDPKRKANDHPCPFPEELPRRCIQSSLHNQIVLDPFLGSGTTCAVAKSLGCNYIGIDLSENYCQIARERIAEISTFFEPKQVSLL